MIHQLVPWRTLTRTGIPTLKVARRPMVIGEVTVPVGAAFDPELFPLAIRRERLRQFYESRRLEPLDPPMDSVQYYREQQLRKAAVSGDMPVAPVTPVASQIVADVPALDVPVAEERPQRPSPKTKPPQPPRRR